MFNATKYISVLFVVICAISKVNASYSVKLQSVDSAVVGSRINISATLYDNGKVATSGDYNYIWSDNDRHSWESPSSSPYSNWTIEYPRNATKPRTYTINLQVQKNYFVWIPIASAEHNLLLTEDLVGKLQLLQNDTERPYEFVSTNDPVEHKIDLRDADAEFLQQHAEYIQTFWFQNCTYLGVSNGLSYEALYTVDQQYYEIEALVVASFEKLPEPTTSTTTTSTTTPKTTTTTSTTTTTTTSTTPKPTTTTIAPNTTSTTPKPKPKTTSDTRAKRDVPETAMANAALLGFNLTAALQQQQREHLNANNNNNNIYTNNNNSATIVSATKALINPKLNINGVKRISYLQQQLFAAASLPYNCVNKTIVARDPKKVYGYFKRRIVSKAPISNFTTSGKNWLQRSELLKLEIKCTGSSTLGFCYRVFDAPYNSTHNETCDNYSTLSTCDILFVRYFTESKSVMFFIRNDVSESINQVTINIYDAKKQSQLSVVVVPVSFTLVAVILVVFGVSYYVQSRNRFTVEVADFNFGETQSVDMEYKTFQQRLIESICEAMPRLRRYSQSNADLIDSEAGSSGAGTGPGGVNEPSDIRYNSMN